MVSVLKKRQGHLGPNIFLVHWKMSWKESGSDSEA